MSVPFLGGGQLAGAVLGLISGQVEERLFERGALHGELVEGYAVGGGNPADLGRAPPGTTRAPSVLSSTVAPRRARASASSLGSSAGPGRSEPSAR